MQKIAVNAGLGCPNRDGTIGTGGCSYCSNASFCPSYAKGSIREQIGKGRTFYARKGTPWGYLAYFQSFTGTYGNTGKLIELYEEALACPDVAGLIIATRPDCLAEDLVEYFKRRFGKDAPDGHPFLLVELGIESTKDATLMAVNRGHDWECSKMAIMRLHSAGIAVGVHLIIGLPGENDEDFILHAKKISELPVSTLKLHQLQIVKGTAMARQYASHPEEFNLLTPQRYAAIVISMLEVLRQDIAIDRLVSEAPKSMLVAPSWGLKPEEFTKLLLEQKYPR